MPGAVSNIGPVQGIEDNKPTQEYDKTVTNTNYEISKQIIKTKPQFATIKRLTAAVVVDGRYENVRDENGEITAKINYIPLNENEVNQIRSLVEQAVGYNQARGDQVTVSNFEFRPNNISTPLTKFQRFEEEYIKPLLPVLKYLLVALILFVFYKKVIVPFMNKMLMDTKPQEEAVFEEEIDVEEEAEDTIERFKAAKKRAEDELGMNDDFNEEDLKYDVLLEKMKGIVAERSDEVASLLQSMVKTDNSFSGSKDF